MGWRAHDRFLSAKREASTFKRLCESPRPSCPRLLHSGRRAPTAPSMASAWASGIVSYSSQRPEAPNFLVGQEHGRGARPLIIGLQSPPMDRSQGDPRNRPAEHRADRLPALFGLPQESGLRRLVQQLPQIPALEVFGRRVELRFRARFSRRSISFSVRSFPLPASRNMFRLARRQ